jgi:ectoine hydroxylase-related dioxygenase (phytanoyl-CoA dioxygenase family)
MDMPDLIAMDKNILKSEMNLGDAILFNFKVLHYSPGNSENIPRRAFSMRFIGDDVKYIDRGGETSPPFKGIDLKIGAKMREDWFPVVWSN